MAHAFGLRKRPSKLSRALLNEREVHREQKRPKIAENFAHAGTKLPVSSVNPKARNFEVEISAPRPGFEQMTIWLTVICDNTLRQGVSRMSLCALCVNSRVALFCKLSLSGAWEGLKLDDSLYTRRRRTKLRGLIFGPPRKVSARADDLIREHQCWIGLGSDPHLQPLAARPAICHDILHFTARLLARQMGHGKSDAWVARCIPRAKITP